MLILRKERLDLAPQLGIFAAGFIKECMASFRRLLQRCIEKLFGPLPKIIFHA
jgi:hypothetical protein